MNTEDIRVLHVDDDPDVADLAKVFIERKEPEITLETRKSPQSVLSSLLEEPERIDCIVSDHDMPHKSGLDLLKEVRQEFSNLPFILYTGKGSEEVASEAISLGVDDYMQKGSGVHQYELLAARIKNHVVQTRTAQELENNEEKFRALVEQNIAGIYLIQDGEFAYVNPKLADIFGYDASELLGRPPDAVIAERDQELVADNLEERLSGDTESIRYTFSGKRRDGEEINVEVQGQRIELNGHPAVAGILMEIASQGHRRE